VTRDNRSDTAVQHVWSRGAAAGAATLIRELSGVYLPGQFPRLIVTLLSRDHVRPIRLPPPSFRRWAIVKSLRPISKFQ
jgi:hypothetical protein